MRPTGALLRSHFPVNRRCADASFPTLYLDPAMVHSDSMAPVAINGHNATVGQDGNWPGMIFRGRCATTLWSSSSELAMHDHARRILLVRLYYARAEHGPPCGNRVGMCTIRQTLLILVLVAHRCTVVVWTADFDEALHSPHGIVQRRASHLCVLQNSDISVMRPSSPSSSAPSAKFLAFTVLASFCASSLSSLYGIEVTSR